MARTELGTKRVCPTTGRKFYDMNRDPVVSPYTGEELPRSSFEPPVPARAASRARPDPDETEDAQAVPAGPETVSLEDVGAAEEEGADAGEEDAGLAEDGGDDTFLEEEEESEGGDVSDLIDGEIEDEEEH